MFFVVHLAAFVAAAATSPASAPVAIGRLPGCTTINVSEPWFAHNSSWPALNPSICQMADGGFLLNVRHVSYKLLPNGGYFSPDNRWENLNRAVWLSKDLERLREHHFDGIAASDHPQGHADVRLFRVGDDVHFVSNVFSFGNTTFLHGRYDTRLNHLSGTIIAIESKPTLPLVFRSEEKNWAFFLSDGRFFAVYEWSPLRILEIVDNVIVAMTVNDRVPSFFTGLRGTSGGQKVGDEFWFVAHFTIYGKPRDYLHVLVALDATTFKISRFSGTFKFLGEAVEFCTGLAVTSTHVLFSYGVWDRNALVTAVPIAIVERLLRKPRKNDFD
jgi:hypothetical protein